MPPTFTDIIIYYLAYPCIFKYLRGKIGTITPAKIIIC